MPRKKSYRRSQAAKKIMARRLALHPPSKSSCARRGTGERRVRQWPKSRVTGRTHKLVMPDESPDKRLVLLVGDSHLRSIADGFVQMPEGGLSFAVMSTSGATAADLKAEVDHVTMARTPEAVCLLAPSNNLMASRTDEAAAEFGQLLTSICSRWDKVCVLDFPPRLSLKLAQQDFLRQEFQRVASHMGVEYFPVADNFPLDRLELWCRDGVHLSDREGMQILVQLLWTASYQQLQPPAASTVSLNQRSQLELCGAPEGLHQQDWSPHLDQDPPEPPHIKEEQEEVWTSQEGEFTFSRVPVKSEEEEEAQSSQLHHSQTEQVETGADGEDCGGPEAARNPDPHNLLEPVSDDSCDPETDDSNDWTETRKPFSCFVCDKTFEHQGNLNIHMRTHTGEKPFSCSVCGKRFTQKAGLDYHMRTHTGERPFSCSVCGKRFRHKGALTYHTATHTGLKAFGCSDCGRRFRGTSQLRIHKCVRESSQLHKNQSGKHKKPLSCSKCDATFPNNYVLMTHMRMHKGKKLFTCTVCGQKRQFSSHLEIHMRTHTGDKPYSCSVCGKRFSQSGIVTQHMAVHSGEKPFGCSLCGKRFFWQFQVKKHKCVVESSQRRRAGFNGEDCGGPEPARNSDPDKKTKPSFETDDSVDIEFWTETRHHRSGLTYWRDKKVPVKAEANTEECVGSDIFKQTGPSQSGSNDSHTLQTQNKCPTGERPFSCFFCGKIFMTGGYLTRHISVHTGKELLSCIICEKRFPLESELLEHQCGKGFGRAPQLQKHTRTRTREKPFSCSICSAGFDDSESLVKHMRIHAGQMQFRCSICGKEFEWRRHLMKHMEDHPKEKRYSCRVCNRRFSRLDNFNYHKCAGPQSSQLHNNQTEQVETGADGEDCGGPEAARNPDPHTHLEPDTEDSSETEDSAEDWTETREPQSGLKSVKHDGVSNPTSDAGRKRLSCSICEEQFEERRGLSRHMEVHWAAKQENPEPPHIKEEQEEVWTSQEGEFTFSQVPVKSEEEEAQSSQLHHSQTEQVETEADGEDCGGPEAAGNPDPDALLEHDGGENTLVSFKSEDSVDSDFWKETVESGRTTVSCSESESAEPESEDSTDSDFWKDNMKPQLDLNSLKKSEKMFPHKFHTEERAFLCPVCGLKCQYRSNLKIHMRTHTGEKPFICPVCGKKYAHKASMQSHMAAHTVEKRHTCDVCDRSFVWYTELKYHQCEKPQA